MTDKISALVETQFPAFYRDEGPKFIAFAKAYYEWLEQTGNVGDELRKLPEYQDIDKTIDEFLSHFKNKYLVDFPFTTSADKRAIIKKSLDIYRAKGSEQAVNLVMRLLFGQESAVYLPGTDVIKPSDGVYIKPKYLELSSNDISWSFIGKEITGLTSGAKAFVDRVDRRVYKGLYTDQAFISNLRGNFQTGETVTANGTVDGHPVVIGSATDLEILISGKDYQVGEEVLLRSTRKGRGGKAVISAQGTATGLILFTIIDGGFGFVKRVRDGGGSIVEAGSTVYIANAMFGMANVTNSNTQISTFVELEQIIQYKTQFEYTLGDIWSNGVPPAGTLVVGANATVNIASGHVVSSPNTKSVIVTSIDASFSNTSIDRLFSYASNGAASNAMSLSSDLDVSTLGYVTGQNTTTIGFHTITNGPFTGFYSNVGVQNNYVHGVTSNTYCQLERAYSGSLASFAIGRLTNQEQVYVETDFIAGNNYADGISGPGIPYLNIQINANTSLAGNGYFSNVGMLVGANVVAGGSGYSNASFFTITGGSPTSNAVLQPVTNSTGGIISATVVAPGLGFDSVPSLSISGGAGANILPIMMFGYGFPKLPYGNYNSTISSCLTQATINVGTISLLSELNPGQSYNINPFVFVIEPRVAGFGRKDLRLQVSGIDNLFVPGEVVVQDYYANGYEISFNTYTPGQIVSSVSVTSGGTGYTNGTPVVFGNTTGNGAIALVSTNSTGGILTANVVSGGYGYTTGTTAAMANGAAVLGAVLSNVDFQVGEAVYQSTSGKYGQVVSANVVGASGNMVIQFTTTSFSNNAFIQGLTSGARANVSYAAGEPLAVTPAALLVSSRGEVIAFTKDSAANTGILDIKRLNFNLSFINTVITGTTSGATATINNVLNIPNSAPIGMNSTMWANTNIANGVVVEAIITDAGIGYQQDESVEMSPVTGEDGRYIATARINLGQQGVGTGYFKNTKGFLNSDKYIHDNDYYQEHSYEVQTGVSLDSYAAVLKQVLHVAGTKYFGKVIKVLGGSKSITVANSAVSIN